MENKVISTEYVKKNFIKKSDLKDYFEGKINELREIHNNSNDSIEREISKGMAVLFKMAEKDLLEETEDEI